MVEEDGEFAETYDDTGFDAGVGDEYVAAGIGDGPEGEDAEQILPRNVGRITRQELLTEGWRKEHLFPEIPALPLTQATIKSVCAKHRMERPVYSVFRQGSPMCEFTGAVVDQTRSTQHCLTRRVVFTVRGDETEAGPNYYFVRGYSVASPTLMRQIESSMFLLEEYTNRYENNNYFQEVILNDFRVRNVFAFVVGLQIVIKNTRTQNGGWVDKKVTRANLDTLNDAKTDLLERMSKLRN